jgi:hypothetical protein
MNAYRAAALAVAGCLTSLSLAACSGGLTNASPPAAAPPASSGASTPASGGAPPASTPAVSATGTTGSVSTGSVSTGSGGTGSGGTVDGGNTVNVGGTLGTFPIPTGTQVVSNGTNGDQIELVLGGVNPDAMAHFYGIALPQAGYTVQSNTLATVLGVATGGIDFTGHGYKGSIGDLNGTIGVTLTPQG